MAINEDILKGMDDAAETAEEKLKEIQNDHIVVIANWWKENYLKAGHKRLAKILLNHASKKETY
jgi:hypothetical protein